MKTRMPFLVGMTVIVGLCVTGPALAQDLGPDVKKLADGVYVYSKDYDSNVGIIITQDGVVLIDTGQNPNESLVVMDLVQKLTSQPVRYIINTEPHGDHTSGNFVFSPPASVIAAAGAGALMAGGRPPANVPGARIVLPHIEYGDKMTLRLGGHTVELLNLKNVHSGADTGIWLPNERILFAAATVVRKRYSNIRTFVTIPDILASIEQMRALTPEVVVPGQWRPRNHGDLRRIGALLCAADRTGQEPWRVRARRWSKSRRNCACRKTPTGSVRKPFLPTWMLPWRVVKGEN